MLFPLTFVFSLTMTLMILRLSTKLYIGCSKGVFPSSGLACLVQASRERENGTVLVLDLCGIMTIFGVFMAAG